MFREAPAVAAAAVAVAVPNRAQAFGELMEAAYDQHRTILYTQLRWPLPANPHQERAEGHRLSSYLWRGSDDMSPAFIPPAEAAPDRAQGGSGQDLPLNARNPGITQPMMVRRTPASSIVSGAVTSVERACEVTVQLGGGWESARRVAIRLIAPSAVVALVVVSVGVLRARVPKWGQAPAWMWEAHTDGVSQPHRRRIRRTAACTAPATSPSPVVVRVV